MKDRTPREYAEAVLGRAATREQLDELFELLPNAHPIVTHSITAEMEIRGEWWHNIKTTTVQIFNHRPGSNDVPASLLAEGVAWKSPADEWNRRRGTTIAFGRALKELREREKVEERVDAERSAT